jgi:hypothetical protein
MTPPEAAAGRPLPKIAEANREIMPCGLENGATLIWSLVPLGEAVSRIKCPNEVEATKIKCYDELRQATIHGYKTVNAHFYAIEGDN